MLKDPNTRSDLTSARAAGQLLSGQHPEPSPGPGPYVPDPHPIARLVPHSGIQFIDLTLPAAVIAQTLLSFAEHRYASGGRFRTVLMPLDRAGSGDVVWHPVSHRALAPAEIMSVSGQAALEGFAGRWLPLPFLRFLGRDADGQPAFDSGPENWARVYIAPNSRPSQGASADDAAEPSYRLVLAFDTRLEAADRTGDRLYLAPNADDATLGASFKLATGAADLARFASRPWVDGWLRQVFEACRAQTATSASAFELEHVARYLVLVELLGRCVAMPEIRFLDTLSRRWPATVSGVDLLLDISAADTAAVLVDGDVDSGGALMAAAAPLDLRDLTHPVARFSGVIPTRFEFAPSPFGDAGFSRRSGRTDAFMWPSLGRIGQEAAALALGATATSGVTGQEALPSLLGDTEPAGEIWRIGSETAGDGIGPVVSGALLAHVAEDGTPLASSGGEGRAPAVRPRFAPSSLMTFFAAELLLHAVSAINAVVATATDAGRAAGARRLRRIVLTLPAGMAEDVRASHAAHFQQAVDLVWRALGWDAARDIGTAPRPEIVIGPGVDLAAQVFDLRREMATRYGNDPAALVRDRAPAFEHDSALVAVTPQRRPPVVRVASLELGCDGSGAIVTDYAVGPDGTLAPLQAASERWSGDEHGIVTALANRFVLDAMATALAAHGIFAPGVFLSRVLDTATVRNTAERNLARRLQSKLIRPAASALLRIAGELPPHIAGGQRVQLLRGLVERGGGRFDPYAADFDALALRDGATAFKLERIEIRFNQRQLDQAIRTSASAFTRRAVELVTSQGCDLVLLSGDLAALPAVADGLVAALPLEPGRIVFTAHRAVAGGDGSPPGAVGPATGAALAPSRIAGLAGAYLAGRAVPGFEAFDRVVRAIAHDVSTPLPAPSPSSLVSAGGDAPRPMTIAASAGAVAADFAASRET